MINIIYRKKLYQIQKEKLVYVLEKINGEKIDKKKIKKYMKKYKLFDEMFLKTMTKL